MYVIFFNIILSQIAIKSLFHLSETKDCQCISLSCSVSSDGNRRNLCKLEGRRRERNRTDRSNSVRHVH